MKKRFIYCLRLLVVLALVCNVSGAFATKNTIFDNPASIKENGFTISGSNGDTTIYKYDLNIEEKVTKNKYGIVTSRVSPSVSIGNDISDDKREVVIVEGNLTIKNESVLTVKQNSVLIVKGNLTIEADATLNLNENSSLFVFGDLNQNGWSFIVVTTGNINANNVGMAVIGGNYNIYEGALGYDTDNGSAYLYPDRAQNFYVLGSNNLPSGHGKPQGPAEYEEKTGQTALSESAISTLLPIELTSFTATATDNGFAFNWVTASEKNNDYFTLEYSIDGVDFNEIDYVHGAGTTSETSEYTYSWDDAPNFEMIYFRLKQTDYNGEYTYSDVIVSCRKKSAGATRTFRYGPLNLQVVDGELRYIENKK